MGSKKKKITIGYRYYFTIHMGICRGSIDELIEVRVADKTAWTGSVTSNSTIQIDAPDLFGGDTQEGGVQGPMDIMLGAADQPRNDRLLAFLSGLVPAFRRVTTFVFDGLVCALSPYPKAWSFRTRTALAGWDGEPWYPEKARVILNATDGTVVVAPDRDDYPPDEAGLQAFAAAYIAWRDGAITTESNKIVAMNPAHILYKCLTHRDWGRGLARTRIDDGAFRAAADQMASENFGLCIKWTRQGLLSEFMQGVLDHCGATMYADRSTGLIKLKLIRNDYDPEDLELFDYDSGLLGIDDDDGGALAAATAEIVVNYRSVVQNQDAKVRVRNLAALRSQEGVTSEERDYPGIPTAGLALRVAQRDLKAASGFVKRFTVRLDRRGNKIYPGKAFAIRELNRGIEFLVLRAGQVEDSPLSDGTITVRAVTDVFGLPVASYVKEQDSQHDPPTRFASPVTAQRVDEISYRDLLLVQGAAAVGTLDADAAFLRGIGVRPNSLALSFLLESGVSAYNPHEEGDFTPSALLAAGIDYDDTTVSLASGIELDNVTLDSAALIDDEIVRIDAIDLELGQMTIARGCVDSLPAPHSSGARIWFYQGTGGVDDTEYLSFDALVARLRTRTSVELLDPAFAYPMTLSMIGRQGRPYPPVNVLINAQDRPVSASFPLTITWEGRNRIVQADTLVGYYEGSIDEQDGTTYQLQLFNADTDALLLDIEDLDPAFRTYTNDGTGPAFTGVTNLRLALRTVRAAVTSQPGFVHEFART